MDDVNDFHVPTLGAMKALKSTENNPVDNEDSDTRGYIFSDMSELKHVDSKSVATSTSTRNIVL